MLTLQVAALLLALYSGNHEPELPIHAEFSRRALGIASSEASPEVSRARRAFHELDRRTHAGYLRECAQLEGDETLARLAGSIDATARHLMGRLLVRVAVAREGGGLALRLPRLAHGEIEAVELVFRSALQENFQVPGGRGDVPFEQAFLAYSSGGLRVPGVDAIGESGEVHGGPNGCYHLAFAEAALLFIEEDLQPDFWRALLPALVQGSELFVETHWNGAGRSREDYQAPREIHPASGTGRVAKARTADDFERLVTLAFADERIFRSAKGSAGGGASCNTEVLVKAALFVEDENEPGTYLEVDLGSPELSGEEVAALMELLQESYVTLAEKEQDQAGILLEHMKEAEQEVGLEGVVHWESPSISRFDPGTNQWEEVHDGICLPYSIPPGSALDPDASYFVCTWIAL